MPPARLLRTRALPRPDLLMQEPEPEPRRWDVIALLVYATVTFVFIVLLMGGK